MMVVVVVVGEEKGREGRFGETNGRRVRREKKGRGKDPEPVLADVNVRRTLQGYARWPLSLLRIHTVPPRDIHHPPAAERLVVVQRASGRPHPPYKLNLINPYT